MPDIFTQHLVTKIGAGVHYNSCFSRLYQNTGPKPLVFFICGSTNLAFASDHRHTAAGAGAEESYFQAGISHPANVKRIM